MDPREIREEAVTWEMTDLGKWMGGFAKPFGLSFLAYLIAVLIYESAAETLDKANLSWGWFSLTLGAVFVGVGYGALGRCVDAIARRSIVPRRVKQLEAGEGLTYAGVLLLVVWALDIAPKTMVVIFGVALVGLEAAYRLGPVKSWIDMSLKPRAILLVKWLYRRPAEFLWIGFAGGFLSSAVADYSEQRVWAELLSEIAFLMLVGCALSGFVRALRDFWSGRERGT